MDEKKLKAFNAFVEKARAKWGDRFEYDPDSYTQLRNDVTFTDKKTGKVYVQRGGNHLKSLPRELRSEEPSEAMKNVVKYKTPQDVIDEISDKFSNHTIEVEHFDAVLSRVKIICPDGHEVVRRFTDVKDQKEGCFRCSKIDSGETTGHEVLEVLKEHPYVELKGNPFELTWDSDLVLMDEDFGEYTTKVRSFFAASPSIVKHPQRAQELSEAERREKLIKDLKEKHPDLTFKEDFDFKGAWLTSITYICPIHGEHTTKSENLLRGRGCFKCSHKDRNTLTQEEALERLKELENPYNCTFEKVVYTGHAGYVTITCPIHGDFQARFQTMWPNHRVICPDCRTQSKSSYEIELLNFIKEIKPDAEILTGRRMPWLNYKELDIIIEDLKLAIEFNGSQYHHSSEEAKKDKFLGRGYKDPEYHKEKYLFAKRHGYDLIHIFEFEDLYLWKKWLELIIKDPDAVEVSFENTHRKVGGLEYYGQTFIVPRGRAVDYSEEIAALPDKMAPRILDLT